MSNPFLGLPLDYLIGKDGGTVGQAKRAACVAYDVDSPPSLGPSIAYCNLLDERDSYDKDTNQGKFGPYLPQTDTAKKYDEGVPDPDGPGFEANLRDQFQRRQDAGFKFIELDNPDAYSIKDVIRAIDLAQSYGLGVVAKNPGLMGTDADRIIIHPNVFGIIVEKDAGAPRDMDELRRDSLKPDLSIWFVSFGSGLEWVRGVAAVVTSRGYRNMSATWSNDGEYGNSVVILDPIKSAEQQAPMPQLQSQVDGVAILAKARSYIGKLFDGPDVVIQARAIAQVFPDLARYCDEASNSMPWCGDFIGFILKDFGIRPPLTKDGVGFFYVDRWLDWGAAIPVGQEQPGDVAIFLKKPHHVTFVVGNGKYVGGNQYRPETGQSDAVTEASYRRPDAIRRAPLPGMIVVPPQPQPAALRPMIEIRDTDANTGGAVSEAQRLLGEIGIDGEFGTETDAAVRSFQALRGLEIDGVIGPETWAALLSDKPIVPGFISNTKPLASDMIARISTAVLASEVSRYSWVGRGVAPIGYTKGMAVTYAYVYAKWRAGDSSARVMAQLPTGDTERDALAWYGVTNIASGASTLRALFTLLLGLGMRESSGKYWEGLDTNAGFKSADETEAGLFQQSWNSRVASPELPKLFAAWLANTSDGLLPIFREGVPAGSSPNLGGGQGEQFQALCKSKPAFTVEAAAICLRVLGGSEGHFGPIRRREVEFLPAAATLFQQVETIVDSVSQPSEPQKMPPEIIPPGQPLPNQIDPQQLARVVTEAVQAALPSIIAAVQQRLGQMPLALPPPAAAPPPVTQSPPVAAAPPAQQWPTNVGVGLAGALAAAVTWFTGGLGDTASVLTGAASLGAGLLGIPAPVVNVVTGLFSDFLAGRAARKAKAAP